MADDLDRLGYLFDSLNEVIDYCNQNDIYGEYDKKEGGT